jgi:hypothetical protein
VTLLAAMAAHFEDSHTLDADFLKGVFHGFKFGGLNDGFNFDHECCPELGFEGRISESCGIWASLKRTPSRKSLLGAASGRSLGPVKRTPKSNRSLAKRGNRNYLWRESGIVMAARGGSKRGKAASPRMRVSLLGGPESGWLRKKLLTGKDLSMHDYSSH